MRLPDWYWLACTVGARAEWFCTVTNHLIAFRFYFEYSVPVNQPRKWKAFASVLCGFLTLRPKQPNGQRNSRDLAWVHFRFSRDLFWLLNHVTFNSPSRYHHTLLLFQSLIPAISRTNNLLLRSLEAFNANMSLRVTSIMLRVSYWLGSALPWRLTIWALLASRNFETLSVEIGPI